MSWQGKMPPARTLTGESRGLTFPQKVVKLRKRPIFQVQHVLQYYLNPKGQSQETPERSRIFL